MPIGCRQRACGRTYDNICLTICNITFPTLLSATRHIVSHTKRRKKSVSLLDFVTTKIWQLSDRCLPPLVCTCREPIGTSDKLVVYDKWNVSLSSARARQPLFLSLCSLRIASRSWFGIHRDLHRKQHVTRPMREIAGDFVKSRESTATAADSITAAVDREKRTAPPPPCAARVHTRGRERVHEKRRSCLPLFLSLSHSLALFTGECERA